MDQPFDRTGVRAELHNTQQITFVQPKTMRARKNLDSGNGSKLCNQLGWNLARLLSIPQVPAKLRLIIHYHDVSPILCQFERRLQSRWPTTHYSDLGVHPRVLVILRSTAGFGS